MEVAPSNVAPVLNPTTSFTMNPVAQDAVNLGTNVFDLIASARPASGTTDPAGLGLGIAVTGVDNTNGTWQFSIDGGTTWEDFNAPSNEESILLDDSVGSYVRFVPTPGFIGTVTTGLTFRLWDLTNPENHLPSTQDLNGSSVDTTVNGGSTAYSESVAGTGVTVVAPPVIVAAFTPGSIALNGTSSLTFTLTNPAPDTASGVSFTDVLPAGLTVANGSSSVGGGILTTTGNHTITLSSASIPANGQLAFSVTVSGIKAGISTTTTGHVSSSNGGIGKRATASLTVAPNLTISQTVLRTPNSPVGAFTSPSKVGIPFLLRSNPVGSSAFSWS